ncbi:hypothetical protein [Pseudactinotalea suaedae]|uniref:hypothetical protein n=1 Tax=Pseudactinotalea suaedae TaxID=1524924 RepID=UPI0012E1C991|nr:hypothetical protein [Pseudactinotalea suaedae]
MVADAAVPPEPAFAAGAAATAAVAPVLPVFRFRSADPARGAAGAAAAGFALRLGARRGVLVREVGAFPAGCADAGRGASASRLSRTRARRRTSWEASAGRGACEVPAAVVARAGSAGASGSAADPARFAAAPRSPGPAAGRGAREETRRVRASAGVVMRPTAATSSGSAIGTTRAARPAGTVPGRREPSAGTGPTARRSPRGGNGSSVVPSPDHHRGGRTPASPISTSGRTVPSG